LGIICWFAVYLQVNWLMFESFLKRLTGIIRLIKLFCKIWKSVLMNLT